MHRYDDGRFYPGIDGAHDRVGTGKGEGYNIHFPFNASKAKRDMEDPTEAENIGDYDYIYACEVFLFPLIRQFQPDLIIVSAGFDSAKGDPLGGIAVTPVGYAWITQGLRSIQNRVAVVLEGGYNLESLEVSSEAVIKVLKASPGDSEAFDGIVAAYGYEEAGAYEMLKDNALL